MAGKKRVGIVLFQLGGPDSLEAVEPFLLNLFLDPDIIPLGPLGFLRWPIAKLISVAALDSGGGEIRGDRAAFANSYVDGAATRAADRGVGAVHRSGCGDGDALLAPE